MVHQKIFRKEAKFMGLKYSCLKALKFRSVNSIEKNEKR